MYLFLSTLFNLLYTFTGL